MRREILFAMLFVLASLTGCGGSSSKPAITVLEAEQKKQQQDADQAEREYQKQQSGK